MRLWVASGPLDGMAWTRSARAGRSGFGRAGGSEEWPPAEVVQGGVEAARTAGSRAGTAPSWKGPASPPNNVTV